MSLLNGFGIFILFALFFWLVRRIKHLEAEVKEIQQELLPTDVAVPASVQRSAKKTVAPAPQMTPPLSASITGAERSKISAATSGGENVPAASSQPADSLRELSEQSRDQDSHKKKKPSRKVLKVTSPLIGWFLRSHALVQIGMVVLFIGVAFLLKYVADRGWFSIEMRHVSAAVGGVLLSTVGWRLRDRMRTYALALQGGGLGVIYLTTFFAYRVYDLIPAPLAFGFFVLLGTGAALFAVLNNARILAFLAIVGAFLAPILASDSSGSHIMLFSYYTVVNGAILLIAWFKAWRSLNLAGFLFTVAAAVAWGSSEYTPDLFGSTEPFLILFFLFYVIIALLFALRSSPRGEASGSTSIDLLILFGNPIAALSMQAILVRHMDHGLGWSALAAGIFYTLLAVALPFFQKERRPLLFESFLFLGFLFLTLSVPYFFDPQTTSATWAILGAAWVWLGSKRRQIWTILWGILVQGIAAVAFGVHLWENDILFEPPFANALFFGMLLLAAAGLFSGYLLRKPADSLPKYLNVGSLLFSLVLSGWGMFWWFGGGIAQIIDFASDDGAIMGILAFVALSAAVGEFLGLRLSWWVVRLPALLLICVMALLALIQLLVSEQPFVGGGFVAWPLAFLVHYWMLHNHQAYRAESGILKDDRLLTFHHVGGLWLFTLLLTWFASWQVEQITAIGNMVTLTIIAVPSLIVLTISRFIELLPWPFTAHRQRYLTLGLAPIVFITLFWTLIINLPNSGDSSPLTYLPLLNPLGLAQGLMFGSFFLWRGRVQAAGVTILNWLWGLALFAAINLEIARVVHQLGGVAYRLDALYHSGQLQTIYAIFWGALALVLVITANRRHIYALWFTGIALLGVTVLKLFVVDLANSGSLARIISFIGVGLLTITLAYFAPAPRTTSTPEEEVSPDGGLIEEPQL